MGDDLSNGRGEDHKSQTKKKLDKMKDLMQDEV